MLGDKTAFGLPPGNVYGAVIGNASGAGGIDWNGNGTIEGNRLVQANVNSFTGILSSPAGEILRGYDDWANLNFNFRSAASYRDFVHIVPNDEITFEILEAFHESTKAPVVPEFPPAAMLAVLILLALALSLVFKRKLRPENS